MRHNLSLVFLILISHAVFSQKTETITLRKFTQKNGLSSYNVRKVIQDRWGFIWAGTQDGLSRFDGRSFVNYTKNSPVKNRISGIDVRELIEDEDKDLIWILPGEVGINAINSITGEIEVSASIPYTSNDDWNISMLKNKSELWIGTSTGIKIYNIRKQTFESLTMLRSATASIGLAVRSMGKDKNGNIWACYDRFGIIIYNGVTKDIIKEIKLSDLNNHRQTDEISFLSYVPLNGSMIFASDQGLRQIDYSDSYQLTINNAPCQAQTLLNTEHIEYIALDKQNNLIISGFNKLYKFNASLTSYTLQEESARMGQTDWLTAVQCLYTDRDNNIWMGCQEGLAFVSNRRNPFKLYSYDKITNTKLAHIRSIYPLPGGNILAGLRDGMVQIDSASNRYTKYDADHLYHHIFQDNHGFIHVSRPDGMFIFENGKLYPIASKYPEFAAHSLKSINSHIFIGDSLVILGTESDNGILLWYPLSGRVKNIDKGNGPQNLSSSIVNNVFRDSQENIWVLSDNVITILSRDLKRRKELLLVDKHTSIHYKLFFDMCEAQGYYWITSYGSGILQLDSSLNIVNVLNTQNNLSNDGVYQIFNLAEGKLMITSNNGMSILDITTLHISSYFEDDGLHSNAFEEVAGLAQNGLIYAGGVNGFSIIDPSRFGINARPPVFYFTDIRLELSGQSIKTISEFNLSISSITIPNNWLQANISFVGLNYANPNRVTYRYRIRENDTSWINHGIQTFINIIGLPPGKYTLEVKAINEDGYESTPKSLILIFEPKWYQTVWFTFAVVLFVSGLLYLLYRYRVSQIRRQQQIRKDIASDLHDDIGSTLNTVKIFTHMARKEQDKESHLEQIENSLIQANTGLRDMIWVLDDSQDTTFELLERIKKFALPVLHANNIRLETHVESDDHKLLSKTEKRNLLLIAKETINNSIKYAQCRNISLEIRQVGGKTTFSISDDGRGFDTNNPEEGNGLKNIQQRARQINYKIQIVSFPGKGTRITLANK